MVRFLEIIHSLSVRLLASDLPAWSCTKTNVVDHIAAFVLGQTPELAVKAMSLPDPDLVKAIYNHI